MGVGGFLLEQNRACVDQCSSQACCEGCEEQQYGYDGEDRCELETATYGETLAALSPGYSSGADGFFALTSFFESLGTFKAEQMPPEHELIVADFRGIQAGLSMISNELSIGVPRAETYSSLAGSLISLQDHLGAIRFPEYSPALQFLSDAAGALNDASFQVAQGLDTDVEQLQFLYDLDLFGTALQSFGMSVEEPRDNTPVGGFVLDTEKLATVAPFLGILFAVLGVFAAGYYQARRTRHSE